MGFANTTPPMLFRCGGVDALNDYPRSHSARDWTATRADPLGLTPREREVLDLICTGHTNAEIAAELFISTRTAGHHVPAVLAKLDAPTREVAAAHAARLGLVGAAHR
jgi:DNA-binding CsgD family transcriptional regulator